MSRETDNGTIENLYRLQVMNISESAHRYSIAVSGLEGIDFDGDHIVEVPASASRIVPVAVRIPAESGQQARSVIWFDVAEISNPQVAAHEKATFLMP
jgi:polyferredoxin